MKVVYIRGGKPENPTVKILSQHLMNLGHSVVRTQEEPWDVGVAWGCSYLGDKPFLNARANEFDKREALIQFEAHNILAPEAMEMAKGAYGPLPLLARKRQHSKGKDIIVCQTLKELTKTLQRQRHDYFVPWIPTQSEFRVWVFRKKALAVYEKIFTGVGEYKGFIRNRRFGFKFMQREDLREQETLVRQAVNAVKVLGLDFGAVDVLQGKDNKFYVLEVNTMPSIPDLKRSTGVRLVNRISKWAEKQ